MLEFILLPFVKLHHIDHIFFFFKTLPPQLTRRSYTCLRDSVTCWGSGAGEQSWERKSTGHFAQDLSLTGGVGHLLPTLGSGKGGGGRGGVLGTPQTAL